MTTQTWQDDVAEVWQLFRETDAQIKETSVQLQKTDQKIRELSGLFTSQWGRMVEALVEPSALQLFQERGIDVRYVYRRVEAQVGGRSMEIDILLENGNEVIIIEVKSILRVEDVRDHLDTLSELLTFFPRYKNYRIYGGVAGLTMAEDADKYAYRKGLFVLSATGDGIARIQNDMAFQPRDFGSSET